MSLVPLHETHLSLGAKMGPFGGWDMPIEYTAGTVAEHTAVRTAVGIFDVSHMGKVRILGAGAYAFANSVFTNDLDRIKPGQAQYSMLCNDTGGVIDDLIVYLVSDEEVRFIPNAGNASTVVAHLEKIAPAGIVIENNHLKQGIIAVQGPSASKVVSALGLLTDHDYMAFADAKWNGFDVNMCRTGYTGEPGYELVIENAGLVEIWNALLSTGAELGILPCGLGARDTLRTEMGYVLHGQDISAEISPVQARTGWAVGWNKPEFSGKDALAAEKAAGAKRVAWGLLATGRGIPRSHMQVKNSSGEVVGETTSGTFSPTLQKGIALALLSPDVAAGDTLLIDVRGRDLEVIVTKPPFITASPKVVDDYLQGFSMGDVNIVPTDKIISGLIQAEIDQKTKPLASLGKIETLALQLGVIYQTKSPRISKPVVFICAGNHGITRQGVSAYPSEVTAQMLLNFKNGGAAINVLAKTFGLEVEIVNAGVDVSTIEHLGDMNLPVAYTTQDFLSQDAMTSMQCEAAIALGYKRAIECIEAGTNFVLLGEMGIGNTSAAAIITSLMTGFPLDTCVGRGTGLGEQAFKVKQQTLSAAIEFHGREHEPMTVLRKFGGLEIAALVGIIFAATQSGCAVLVDGFITTSAALIAVALQPNVSDYLIFSHLSKEPGHRIALDHLAGTAVLSLDLCLGEGSGAALAFPIVKAASEILCDMATFESAAVATAKSGVQ